jgi:type IV pilus assembly protein PilB
MHRDDYQLLGELLYKNGFISRQHIEKALATQQNVRKKIGEILLDLNALSEENLLLTLSAQISVPLADKEALFTPDMDLVRLIPEPFAKEHGVLPLCRKGNTVDMAMSDPENITIIDSLKKLAKAEIRPLLVGRQTIEQAVKRAYDAIT